MFNIHITAIFISYTAFLAATIAAVLYLIQDNLLKNKSFNPASLRMPGLAFLDKLNYRAIGMGFPILTLALASGFLRNWEIHGSYLILTPRTAQASAIWLIYAFTLHVRMSSKMRGKKVALLSILAFGVIIFSLVTTCPKP